MKVLRTIVLVMAFLATTVPIAHLLELPTKLTLEGPLWLSIQQNLYRGWNTVFTPIEILALLGSSLLFFLSKNDRHRSSYLIAAICYVAMILYFFLFNDLVNNTLSKWTAATLPHDWAAYRLKWETGHVLAAVFSLVAFAALLQARIREEASPATGAFE